MKEITKLYYQLSTDISFKIWLSLIALTLVSASIGESDTTTIGTTLFVCSIVIMKGRWVIDEFMGLKNAAPLTRSIVKGYFYSMTCIVALTVGYTQSSFN